MKEVKKPFDRMTRAELIEMLERLRGSRAEESRQPTDLMRVLHDLEVHQVELEMQNRELKETHQLLEDSRNRYADLYDFAPISYVTLDSRGQILEVNLTGATMFGLERSRLIGRPFTDFIEEEYHQRFLSHLTTCFERAEERAVEVRLQMANTKVIDAELLSAPFQGLQPGSTFIRIAVADITERKQAAAILQSAHDELESRVREKTRDLAAANVALRDEIAESRRIEGELQQSEADYIATFNSVNDAILVHDIDTGKVLIANARASEIYGYTAEELRELTVSDLCSGRPPCTPDEAAERLRRVAEGNPQLFESLALHKSGRLVWVEINLKRAAIGGRDRLLAVVRDVTKRKEIEVRLREQSELIDQAQEAILIRSQDGRILFWNRGAERMYGWTAEEAVGRDISELIRSQSELQEFEEADRAVIERGEWAGECRHVTRTGREITVDSHWTLVHHKQDQPASVLIINMDITDKKNIEAQFLRVQRVESIGALAAGIAHDINNVLSPILMATELLQFRHPDQETQLLLGVLRRNAVWGGEMVKQVLEFARGVQGERVVLQPRHLIKDTLVLLGKTLPKSIAIESSIPSDLWTVRGVPAHLHQVLINLCLNARDAMPRGGTLSVSAENVVIEEGHAPTNGALAPGRYTVTTIKDTGVGIGPEIMNKIFDPFFTTKEPGKGTGLGLSTVLGIVKSHGGHIDVQSEVGKGSVFRVFLPASDAPQPAAQPARSPELEAGYGEGILVVDDEAPIREITVRVLESFGYRVFSAHDGAEALALYAKNRDIIKVVLMDLLMPFMDGLSTIKGMRAIDPGIKIIVSTGLQKDQYVLESLALGVESFLAKPYTAEKLLSEVASALGRTASPQRESSSAPTVTLKE